MVFDLIGKREKDEGWERGRTILIGVQEEKENEVHLIKNTDKLKTKVKFFSVDIITLGWVRVLHVLLDWR